MPRQFLIIQVDKGCELVEFELSFNVALHVSIGRQGEGKGF